MADKLIELLRESTLIQGLMALGATVTMGILFIENKPVPQTLIDIVFVIVGYYFGSKAQSRIMKGRYPDVTRYDASTNPRTDSKP